VSILLLWYLFRVSQKTQHLIKLYLSVDIYAIIIIMLSSIGWYCHIGKTILHNYRKFHYLNRSDFCKIKLLITLLNNRLVQVLVEVRKSTQPPLHGIYCRYIRLPQQFQQQNMFMYSIEAFGIQTWKKYVSSIILFWSMCI